MSDIRPVTATFAVAPQIAIADLPAIAADGFKLVINNRPDAETPDQPTSDSVAEAARAAGLAYVHIPVRGMPTAVQTQAMVEAIDQTKGPVLAFCRSGTRSITAWAMGQAQTGASSRADLIELGRGAGYDLSAALA